VEPDLHELVSKYQIHTHSQSCRKYKNIPCRFHYGRYFTSRTICAKPLSDQLDENERNAILYKRAEILKKVQVFIDTYLSRK